MSRWKTEGPHYLLTALAVLTPGGADTHPAVHGLLGAVAGYLTGHAHPPFMAVPAHGVVHGAVALASVVAVVDAVGQLAASSLPSLRTHALPGRHVARASIAAVAAEPWTARQLAVVSPSSVEAAVAGPVVGAVASAGAEDVAERSGEARLAEAFVVRDGPVDALVFASVAEVARLAAAHRLVALGNAVAPEVTVAGARGSVAAAVAPAAVARALARDGVAGPVARAVLAPTGTPVHVAPVPSPALVAAVAGARRGVATPATRALVFAADAAVASVAQALPVPVHVPHGRPVHAPQLARVPDVRESAVEAARPVLSRPQPAGGVDAATLRRPGALRDVARFAFPAGLALALVDRLVARAVSRTVLWPPGTAVDVALRAFVAAEEVALALARRRRTGRGRSTAGRSAVP